MAQKVMAHVITFHHVSAIRINLAAPSEGKLRVTLTSWSKSKALENAGDTIHRTCPLSPTGSTDGARPCHKSITRETPK